MEIVAGVLLLVAMLAREWSFQQERKDNLRQTQELLQRIQAPSVAVMSHATEEPREPMNGLPLLEDSDYETLLNG